MSKRAEYIRANYKFESTPTGWRAVSPYGTIEGTDRAETAREARCQWGHHNFEDEARAFSEIFPR